MSFQMPAINLNLKNFVLAAAILGSIYLFFVTIGPQGISSARGQMNTGSDSLNLKNLNLRAAALPVESFKGGQKAPGVNVNEMTVTVPDFNVNVHYRYYTMSKFEDFSAFQILREINFGHFEALRLPF